MNLPARFVPCQGLRKMCTFYCLVFVALLTVVPIARQELSYRLYCCFQAVTRDLKTKWSQPLIWLSNLLSYLSPPCLSSLIHLIPPYPSYPPVSSPPGKAGSGTSKDLKSVNIAFFVHFIFFLRRMKTKGTMINNCPYVLGCSKKTLFLN